MAVRTKSLGGSSIKEKKIPHAREGVNDAGFFTHEFRHGYSAGGHKRTLFILITLKMSCLKFRVAGELAAHQV